MFRFGIKYTFVLFSLALMASLQTACGGGNNTGTCTPACAADEECKSGSCQKKQADTCTPACAADEECTNGTCQKKAACTPACAADEECKSGSCQKKQADTCTPACAADEECVNNACQKKAACSPACAADEECVNNACQKKAACNPACAADEECVNNACQKKQSGEVGAACSTDKPCPTGLDCLAATATESYCFQKCSADTDCTDSYRNACVTVGTDSRGQPLKICVHSSTKDEECGFAGPKQGICKSQKPRLYCDNTTKKCTEATVQTNEGDDCNKAGDNSQPLKICDESADLACTENGKCKKAVKKGEGEPCNTTDANGTPLLCQSGLTCIRFETSLSRCHQTCDATGSGTECTTTGTSCLPLLSGGGGLCMDNQCTSDAECAFANFSCRDAQGGGKLCYPKPTPGPRNFGDLCKDPAAQFGCTNTDPNSFCLRVTDQSGKALPQGYCSRNCTSDNQCPQWDDGSGNKISSTCAQVNQSGLKACLFPCGQPGQTCPAGLTCQNVGQNVCLAPNP